MRSAHEFLKAITVVLGVAALTTVLFQRLRQPVVLGYIIAGVIVGPHVPIPLVADPQIVETMSELGVILLMFSLGLEFSIRKLVHVGPAAGLTAIIQSSIMMWIGFLAGRALGWTTLESVFAGALIAICSTTIIARAFDEQGIKGKLRDLVVGILIVEDLIAILLMAILTALSTKGVVSAGGIAKSGGRLAAFLAVLLVVGMLIVPRTVRALGRLGRKETILIAVIAICFAVALLAQAFGYSVALGAFIAGSLVAESGEERQIEPLVEPVRDLFAAIFFVSVGMQIEPRVVVEHWLAVTVFSLIVVLGKLLGVSVGAFLTGNGIRTSVQAGMSLAQIGEFSFIIAGLGLSLGATRDFLYPIAVSVSAITTLTTPLLIRSGSGVAAYVDRKLPRAVQTFAALYGSWLERLRATPEGSRGNVRRLIKRLVVDVVLCFGLIVGALASLDRIVKFETERLGLSLRAAHVIDAVAVLALVGPLLVAAVRVTRQLGQALALAALPAAEEGTVDLSAAPRRALVVTLQLAVVLLVGLPLLALTQPFLAGWAAAGIFALVLLVLGVVLWRSAADLQGHVKAGAEVLVEALAKQARSSPTGHDGIPEEIRRIMPGIGEPVAVRIEEGSRAVGRSLAQLNLRGLTGASVLAIARGERGVIIPTATEILSAGDVLALAGTSDAIAAARELLEARAAS